MNTQLQTLLDFFQQNKTLTAEEKIMLEKTIKKAKSDFEISEFKLERTEKVKRTTAILLEETIEELEQKRKAVETQNRELEIESALERVRTVAMSMRKSEEVISVCEAMYKELAVLGFTNIRNSQIAIKNDAEQSYTISAYSSDEVLVMGETPYKSSPIVEELYKELGKSKDAFYKKEFSGKEFEGWRKWRESLSALKDEREKAATSLCFYLYSIGEGHLGISTYNPITEGQEEIIKRFKNVFELSYQRYTDVAKAEAQARESQIQLALERVRARTMAMQKTSEFVKVIDVIGEQFIKLGFDFDWVNFSANGIDVSNGIDIWNFVVIPGKYKGANRVFIPFFDHPVFTVAYEKFQEYCAKGNDFYTLSLDKETKDKFADHLFANTVYKDLPDELKKIHYDGNGYITSSVFLKDTWLSIGSYKGKAFTDEQNSILKRFGNGFGQAYTRFLDLQKAEAQARESQIELGLERVRARAMAMQKSDELKELIGTVFTELTKLDLVLTRCVIMIYHIKTLGITWWMANSEDPSNPSGLFVKYHQLPPHLAYIKAWKERHLKWQYILEGKIKKEWDNFLFSETELSLLPDFVIAGMKAPDRVYLNSSFNSFGNLTLASLESLSDEHFDILLRFAKVFDLTYTRFNDLQKAEAQAREAQIELALERVRARTMAMQHSHELSETVYILFQQFKELGENPDQATIGIINEDENVIEYWVTMYGNQMNRVFKFSIDEPHVTNKIYNAWKEQKKSLMIDLSGDALSEFMAYRAGKGGAAINPDEKRRIINVAFFSKGLLNVQSNEERSEESIKLLERFASVFEQTYTRFLDLQKAEAQAREAQIEAALERVRSRSLAMHHTSEIQTVIHSVHEELLKLNISIVGGSFIVINKDIDTDLRVWGSGGTADTITEVLVPNFGMPFCINLINGIKQGSGFFTEEFSRQQKIEYFTELFKHEPWSKITDSEKEEILESEGGYTRSVCVSNHTSIFIINHNGRKFTEEENETLRRFSKVFDQTYTRFLDLQKAEAQAREAKIETSLERVRSRTMAMHKSTDLLDVISVLSEQFLLLGFKIHSANFNTSYRKKDWNLWLYNPGTPMFPDQIHIPYLDNPFFNRTLESLANGSDFSAFVFTKEEKDGFLDHLYSTTIAINTSEERKRFAYNAPGFAWSTVYLKNTALTIANYDAEPYTEEQNAILRKFGNVFEQSYTRFLDLQKAEAQAREAKIEAALERVRARTMAMYKSENLNTVAEVVFNELEKLELGILRCGIGIINKENRSADAWITSVTDEGKTVQISGTESMDLHPLLQGVYNAWLANSDFSYVLEGEDLVEYYKTSGIGKVRLPDSQLILSVDEITTQYYHIAVFEAGGLFAFSANDFPEEAKMVMKRFAAVFNQSYTRFLDLQKAEAQAREAQIELGLERVRAKAMAMQSSEDVGSATAIVFNEISLLRVETMRCGITIIHPDKTADVWAATTTNEGKEMKGVGSINFNDHPLWVGLFDAWQDNKENFSYHLKGDDLKAYYKALANSPNYSASYLKDELPEHFFYASFFEEGAVFTFSLQPHNEENQKILKKFTAVFSLTFRRYQDLKQAEAQTREAKIEASLERVRGKAMSMHSSRDLADTIGVFYHEMELLSVTPRRCGVGLMDKETHVAELSTMNTTEQGDSIEIIGKLKLAGHSVLEGVYDNWILQKEYHPVLRGNEIKEYYQLMRPQIAYPDYPTDTAQYGYFFFFNEGGVYAWTEKELSEDELKIYRRFTSVLSLTYKRYKDLKDAEVNAKEAIKRASLDRVRAETASMRTTKDLEKITPLIWNELTTLGVPFIRCGVFIMDEQQEQIHSFLSTPDGKAIAAFQLPYHSAGELSKVLAHWHKNEIFKDHWDEAAFAEWTKSLVEQGAIKSEEKYSTAHRPVNLDLNFLPFLQGMLYVGSEAPLSEEEILLVQSLTDAFSTAYARYEDFNKLEAAKKQVDSTLNELQATQKQLVQSEKMASLGELTAGIAHEIQNPLNFVNNFSEVNKEMLEELKAERLKPNAERDDTLQDELINDVIGNSEKINHHGKRAGDIVKGMLQHSRSSTGVKEPTDINKLADEYLRLSYHGLRAKDKEFNAEMKTDFDNSIEKINIIPQDIGRVLLNLFNNAFYAVNQQKSKNLISYEPTVSVTTKKSENSVLITVSDNGNGIPQNIVDKIFQPFFTTKPTGSGTGLGLSLSYDIVKAHGGEIKVETKEGEGTQFIIQLPTK